MAVNYPVDIELVIIDDGSKDGTRELYSQWKNESRVLIHEKATNGGKTKEDKEKDKLVSGFQGISGADDLLVRNNNILATTFNQIAQNLSPRIFRVGLQVGF